MEVLAEKIRESQNELLVQLKKMDTLDTSIFRLMENDANTLGCLLADPQKGHLLYSIEQMTTLASFLAQYSFQKEEGYLFLKDLIQKYIETSRNKAVLFDPEFIYVSPDGQQIRFAVLPIAFEPDPFDPEPVRFWLEYLAGHMRTSSFELPGYLIQCLHEEDFGLPGLLDGLAALRRKTYPPRWYKPRARKFTARQPVSLYRPEADPEPVIEPEAEILEETQLIGTLERASAWLEMAGERYDLLFEDMMVGRGMQCSIRLSDASVSIKHARLTCSQQRWYIQDLKSSNHTWLNDKQVVRKMRLKDGMQVRFGQAVMSFHQHETV